MTTSLYTLGAAGLARAFREGRASAVEILEAHLGRIEACDGQVNAVVSRRFEAARAEARALDAARARGEAPGPLAAVPLTVKDQLHLAGAPTTVGLRARKDKLESHDGPLVARLKAAGALVVGKGNVLQLLLGHECDNRVFGRTNNPWALDRTPGGSSGGDAAAVAYGAAALGLGADFGGSLRIPAAFCGLCTLKPTSGRLTLLDSAREPFPAQEGIVPQLGPLARTVEDVALAMEVLAAPGQQAFDPRVPPVPWADPRGVDVRALKVGWYDDGGLLTPSPAIRRAVREAAQALAGDGVQVVQVKPPDLRRALRLFIYLAAADKFARPRQALEGEALLPQLKGNFSLSAMPGAVVPLAMAAMRALGQQRLGALLDAGLPATPAEYFERLGQRTEMIYQVARAWDADGVDAVLCPPGALPAYPHGESANLPDPAADAQVYNVLGFPAGVVPFTRVRPGEESDRPASKDPADRAALRVEAGSAGLPVGVQVVARPWREDLVLATMAALERLASKSDRAWSQPVDPRPTATPAQ